MKKTHSIFFQHLAQTTPYPLLLEIKKAKKSYLYAKDGTKYIDLISGISVTNLGHRHPKVIKAIKKQLNKYLHVMVYGEFIQQSTNMLAQKLVSLLPNNLNCCYFTNSGAEAIEGALKLSKRYTNQTEIISFKGAYHGSTHGALSISGNEERKSAFRPLLPNITFLEFNNTDDLNKITNKTASVIIEPIQGDAGVRIAHLEFLRELRLKCTQTNTILIFDEIQTGIGRTGKMFAFQHYDVIPDVLILAKALGGGLPIGAFISSKNMMNTLTHCPSLGHITTFGGNPVSCAASLATLETLEKENIIDNVEAKGKLFEKFLDHKKIIQIRRIGLMFAIQFSTANEVRKIVKICIENGVICFWFLSCPDSLRIAPPLNIEKKDIIKSCKIILKAINKLE